MTITTKLGMELGTVIGQQARGSSASKTVGGSSTVVCHGWNGVRTLDGCHYSIVLVGRFANLGETCCLGSSPGL